MESFEQFVAVAMESEGLIVSEAIKFPVTKQTKRAAYVETQTHGYEVDLVGARADRLVLATVKSFFGSRGVVAEHVCGESSNGPANRLYAIFNDPVVRDAVVAGAADRYGYPLDHVHLRFYVGRFAGPTKGEHEAAIRRWCMSQTAGAGPVEVYDLNDVVDKVRAVAASKTYRDNAVLVTMKAPGGWRHRPLRQAGQGLTKVESTGNDALNELARLTDLDAPMVAGCFLCPSTDLMTRSSLDGTGPVGLRICRPKLASGSQQAIRCWCSWLWALPR